MGLDEVQCFLVRQFEDGTFWEKFTVCGEGFVFSDEGVGEDVVRVERSNEPVKGTTMDGAFGGLGGCLGVVMVKRGDPNFGFKGD